MTKITVSNIVSLLGWYRHFIIRCGDTTEFCGFYRDVPDSMLERHVYCLSASDDGDIIIYVHK